MSTETLIGVAGVASACVADRRDGDGCWDVDHLADIGKNRARVRSVAAGGGGINVARGVARLGGRATAVHTAGREVGCRLNRLLDEEGIDHIAVDIEGETREALVLFETASRRSQHIVPPGPDLDYGTLQGPEICPLLPHGFSCARKGIFCKN
ncbi:PfkB family carbohydrate kinase [Streptomyces sp. NPDC020883]|uniref:PfkB family carbohydrate kinase n=1 Tax=Streptomyces sp. NPDC020883 TaxID=3365099 RepID=UPI00379E4F39